RAGAGHRKARQPDAGWPKSRGAFLTPGRGSILPALIEAAKHPSSPAEISLVLSNRAQAAGLSHARSAGIETAIIDHTTHGTDRRAFEEAMQKRLVERDIELVCLAGFMRLLTPWFVGQWQERLLNIHPAPLPRLKGVDTPRRALAVGVK